MIRDNILIQIFVAFLSSCGGGNQQAVNTSEHDTTIRLIDGLGSITIRIPPQTDTFFSWINQSDCGKPCEQGMYRFQPKALPIVKESGMFLLGLQTDSVNQFTISHRRPDTLVLNRDSLAIAFFTLFRENIKADVSFGRIVSDTLIKIGGRSFGAIAIDDFDKQYQVFIRRIVAYTFISGNEIQFEYDLLTKRQDATFNNFFNNSFKNLETVRLKDAK